MLDGVMAFLPKAIVGRARFFASRARPFHTVEPARRRVEWQ
jgi:hypothetical protein